MKTLKIKDKTLKLETPEALLKSSKLLEKTCDEISKNLSKAVEQDQKTLDELKRLALEGGIDVKAQFDRVLEFIGCANHSFKLVNSLIEIFADTLERLQEFQKKLERSR
jgi:hypothetical protein